jgi:glycosyltransferase involved in cell wall biosynthesis
MRIVSSIATCCYAALALLCVPILRVLLWCERLRARTMKGAPRQQPLRVAYVLTEISGGKPGGAASHKAGFCKGLLALGHHPTVMVAEAVPGLDRVVSDYHIFTPPSLPKSFPLTLSVLANNISFSKRALALLRGGKPADLICQRHNQMNFVGPLLSRMLKVPFVLEYNSPASWKAAAGDRRNPVLVAIARAIERVNIIAADRIMVVSGVLKENLVKRGIDPQKVVVNPNGADTQLFRPGLDSSKVRKALGLGDKIVVGFAGHHNSNNTWHGTEHLARAVAKVATRRNDVHFLFIGDQGVVNLVTPIIEAEGTKPSVTFATNVPHSEMPSHYAACDILVSPHVHMADGSTFFGSPIKVFEYMAMGKPIVASGIGQLAELLKDQALLTQPGDSSAIADAIVRLAETPGLRAELGNAVRENCLANLTWEHNARRFINAYWSVLANPADPAEFPARENVAAKPVVRGVGSNAD